VQLDGTATPIITSTNDLAKAHRGHHAHFGRHNGTTAGAGNWIGWVEKVLVYPGAGSTAGPQ
jgi:hypothetical protein